MSVVSFVLFQCYLISLGFSLLAAGDIFSVLPTLALKLTVGHRGSLGGDLIEGGLDPVCNDRAIRVAYGQITRAVRRSYMVCRTEITDAF